MNIPNLDKDPTGRTFLIQTGLKHLGFDPGPIDNWPGPRTEAARMQFLKPDVPPERERHLSPEGVEMILEFEGLDQPSRWPGASSGVTIGYGYDLGYTPLSEFIRDWKEYLSATELNDLSVAVGKKGSSAKSIAHNYRGITIKRDDAREVFEKSTLPKWERLTIDAYPGITQWPQPVFDAMVSMTFNRGTDTSNTDRRRELHRIKQVLAQAPTTQGLADIAANIRASKRLWIGQGVDGLLRRRENEARLVETGRSAVV